MRGHLQWLQWFHLITFLSRTMTPFSLGLLSLFCPFSCWLCSYAIVSLQVLHLFSAPFLTICILMPHGHCRPLHSPLGCPLPSHLQNVSRSACVSGTLHVTVALAPNRTGTVAVVEQVPSLAAAGSGMPRV